MLNKIFELIKQSINTRHTLLTRYFFSEFMEKLKGKTNIKPRLIMAAREDNEKIVNFLIQSNLDINKLNRLGDTQFHKVVLKLSEIYKNTSKKL